MDKTARMKKTINDEVERLQGLKVLGRDFPGSPMVKTSPSDAGAMGLKSGWGAEIPHASRSKKIKKN